MDRARFGTAARIQNAAAAAAIISLVAGARACRKGCRACAVHPALLRASVHEWKVPSAVIGKALEGIKSDLMTQGTGTVYKGKGIL
jgi:hypothetical protein